MAEWTSDPNRAVPEGFEISSDLEQAAHDAMEAMFAELDSGSGEVTLAERCYAFRAAFEAWREAEG